MNVEEASFLLLGVASMLPWNSIIVATGYFSLRLPKEVSFESMFSIIWMSSQLLGLIAQIILETFTSFNHFIFAPVAITLISFSLLTFSVFSEIGEYYYWPFCCAMLSVLGASSVFISSGGFALAAHKNSTTLSNYFAIGQGLSGIVVSAIQVFLNMIKTIPSLSSLDEKWIYFTNFFFVVLTLGAATLMTLNSTHDQHSYNQIADAEEIHQLGNAKSLNVLTTSTTNQDSHFFQGSTREVNIVVPLEIETKPQSLHTPASAEVLSETKVSIISIISSLRSFLIPMVLVLAVTLSVFPALVSRIRPCTGTTSDPSKDTTLVGWLFLLYNAGDVGGRLAAKLSTEHTSYTLPVVYVIVGLRFLLLPALMDSNVDHKLFVGGQRDRCWDEVPLSAMLILGLSNG